MSTPAKRVVKKAAPRPTADDDDEPTTNGPPSGPTKRVVKKAPARPVVSDEPEEEEEPRPVKKAAAKSAAPRSPVAEGEEEDQDLRSGWSAAQETIDSTSTWAATFKPASSVQIIKILEASPYASYRRHWINRVGSGNRPFTCLESLGRPCPLCDVGDRPSAVSSVNIALCGDDGEAVVKSWDAGVRVTQTLKTFANDPKIGPLDKRPLYFAVSKTEGTQRQQTQTLVVPARERDLQDDYGVPPLTDAQIERLMAKLYTQEIVYVPKVSELEDIASEMLNEDTGAGSGSGWG